LLNQTSHDREDNNNNIHLVAIFQDNPGKPVRYQNAIFLDFIGTKDDGDGDHNGSCKTCKLQSNCHHQHTTTQLFTGWMPYMSPNQQCQGAPKATEPPEKIQYISLTEFQIKLCITAYVTHWCTMVQSAAWCRLAGLFL